jgi:S1-C subfamily serine protease
MLTKDWLRAFVAIGSAQHDRWTAAGAGVLLLDEEGRLWIATAAHVVDQVGTDSVTVLLSKQDDKGVILVGLGQLQKQHGLRWIRDEVNDLAAALMPYSPEAAMKAISAGSCLPFDDVLPSMACYTIGCPYGVRGLDPTHAIPLVLGGVVSGTNAEHKLIYASAPTFPGNSGGPLVVHRSLIDPTGRMQIGVPTVLLAGIVLQIALVPSPASEDKLPALHLGIAKSADVVLQLLRSSAASDQARRSGRAP